MDKIFFYDPLTDKLISYKIFLDHLNNLNHLEKIVYHSDFYEIFLRIVSSILYNQPIILLDYNLTDFEIKELLGQINLKDTVEIKFKKVFNEEDIKNLRSYAKNWEIILFTSGTTGLPKRVSHSFENLIRAVKVSEKHKDDVWGLAYNPTHIAGLQVFFQALLNQNSIINLFNVNRNLIFELIERFKITHLSATPTFYRLLLPVEKKFTSIKSVACGGERFDNNLKLHLQAMFPNAKIINIYATTEFGSLFASDGDAFLLKKEYENLVKIVDNEIYVHKNLLGKSVEINLVDDFYPTGDQVEVIDEKPLKFKILGRKNEMINIGGYKVNPLEIEEALNSHPCVIMSKVYCKTNSVLGNILIADIKTNSEINEKEIRIYLSKLLNSYKIPRIININVNDEISITRTGKLKRR